MMAPTLRGYVNDVVITYVCGYGTDAANVPLIAKQAILMWIENAFCNRGPDGSAPLLGLYRAGFYSLINGLRPAEYP